MIAILNEAKTSALPLPITHKARQIAQQFAMEQPTAQKADRVRFNTLAVCIVNDYLKMMGIPTHLSGGDSWNPILRLCADVADLEVIGVGRLECCAVRASDSTCLIPPEALSNRIGYVVVQIDELSWEAKLLGFALTANEGELLFARLQPVEALIDRLHPLWLPVLTQGKIPDFWEKSGISTVCDR
jgi:hypothetical protein